VVKSWDFGRSERLVPAQVGWLSIPPADVNDLALLISRRREGLDLIVRCNSRDEPCRIRELTRIK
jgi:hypothetical protein